MHTGVETGNPWIRSTVRNEVRELFENDPQISFREVASEKTVYHVTV